MALASATSAPKGKLSKDKNLILVSTLVAITHYDEKVRGLGPHFHLFVFLAATATLFTTDKHVR